MIPVFPRSWVRQLKQPQSQVRLACSSHYPCSPRLSERPVNRRSALSWHCKAQVWCVLSPENTKSQFHQYLRTAFSGTRAFYWNREKSKRFRISRYVFPQIEVRLSKNPTSEPGWKPHESWLWQGLLPILCRESLSGN